MTFWKRYCELCSQKGTSPNAVASQLGFSNATCTKWKNGSIPSSKSLAKIAEYFNVSTDYLLGNETEEEQLDEIDQQILVLMRKSRDLPTDDKKKFYEVVKGSVNAFIREDNK